MENVIWKLAILNDMDLIPSLPWNRIFGNLNVKCKQKVSCIEQGYQNLTSDLIPHETVICFDTDALWINSKLKILFQGKDKALIFMSQTKNDNQWWTKIQLI